MAAPPDLPAAEPDGAAPLADADPLATALRTGPFTAALDLAIARQGLGLEELQRRLAARGVPISLASLSYWRSGRRRPERERSMRVLRALEDVLNLPRDGLVGLLGPRRPRGRWVGHRPGSVALDIALGVPPERIDALEGLEPDLNNRMQPTLVDILVEVGPDGREQSVQMRNVITALTDGVDRYVYYFDSRDTEALDPYPQDCMACRVGRLRTDSSRSLIGAELLFDAPVAAGKSYAFGYRIGFAGPGPRTPYQEHGIRTTAKLLVMQVRFAPEMLPARCYGYHHNGIAGVADTEHELTLGLSRTVHFARSDAQPGTHGIRWEWR